MFVCEGVGGCRGQSPNLLVLSHVQASHLGGETKYTPVRYKMQAKVECCEAAHCLRTSHQTQPSPSARAPAAPAQQTRPWPLLGESQDSLGLSDGRMWGWGEIVDFKLLEGFDLLVLCFMGAFLFFQACGWDGLWKNDLCQESPVRMPRFNHSRLL